MAFLTVREKAQLGRAMTLLQRYHDRRCTAEKIDPEHDDYDGDPAWQAKMSETWISELIEDDDRERHRLRRKSR